MLIPFRTNVTRRSVLCSISAALLSRVYPALATTVVREQTALTNALKNTRAIAIVVHQHSGDVLATHGNTNSADRPGSLLKPLLLSTALQKDIVSPTTTVFCRRNLRVGDQLYPCTHPQSNVAFTAQEALAYSCNTWFAALALRFGPAGLITALQDFHLHPGITVTLPAQNQLLTLGLAGIMTSPSQIAAAYCVLGDQLGQPFTKPVADGLRDSVSFGMAHNADVRGLDISGKTGTASDPPRQPWSHGWFAGFANIHATPLLISLYLPQGNGADAAHLAQNFFSMCKA
jgi:cell division protein FtsI/penicillin-binding protein 2